MVRSLWLDLWHKKSDCTDRLPNCQNIILQYMVPAVWLWNFDSGIDCTTCLTVKLWQGNAWSYLIVKLPLCVALCFTHPYCLAGCLSIIVLTHAVLGLLYFVLALGSAQLSMFDMEIQLYYYYYYHHHHHHHYYYYYYHYHHYYHNHHHHHHHYYYYYYFICRIDRLSGVVAKGPPGEPDTTKKQPMVQNSGVRAFCWWCLAFHGAGSNIVAESEGGDSLPSLPSQQYFLLPPPPPSILTPHPHSFSRPPSLSVSPHPSTQPTPGFSLCTRVTVITWRHDYIVQYQLACLRSVPDSLSTATWTRSQMVWCNISATIRNTQHPLIAAAVRKVASAVLDPPPPPLPLVGLVVKAFASRAADPRFDSNFRRGSLSRSNHTSDLKIGTPVTTLACAWRYRVSAGTGWPGVSIQWLGESESLNCNFCLSVAARTIVWADQSVRYISLLLGRYATDKQR